MTDDTDTLHSTGKSPGGQSIEIVWESGSGTDNNVADWWYDENDPNLLVVEYTDGTTEDYQFGTVVNIN